MIAGMTLAAEIVADLERVARALPLPAVKALHLPPACADGSRDGEFCAVELADGSLGLSFVLLGLDHDGEVGATLAELRDGDATAGLAGLAATELARDYAHARGARRTLGFAAVNAITRHLYDRAGFVPPAAGGSVGDLDLQRGDHLGMVGLFPPLIDRLRATGAALTVLELRADLAGPRDGWRVTLDPAELAGCNKILSTSTVLLNDTLDGLLAQWRRAERIALVGPGAGCLPDALFKRGVTLMGGSWIDDLAGFKAALAAGRSWGPCATKFALARAAYPGWEILLKRALAASG
jgi:uncharacterized protein (DUF4213/DUF364 family)